MIAHMKKESLADQKKTGTNNEVLDVVLLLKDSMERMEGRLDSIEGNQKETNHRLVRLEEGQKETNFGLKDLESGQEEIKDELRPLSRAHSTDAVTIIAHEQRITRIEKHLVMSSPLSR